MNTANDIKRDLDAKLSTQLNLEWVKACLTFLESTFIGGLPARARLLTLVEDQLMVSNLELSSLGCLPNDIAQRHGTVLRGQFLVQVQDCINVSEPSDRRYNHSAHRTLKLGLFDGKVSVSAMELTHIPQISMDMPAGFKMIIKDPRVSRGILVLTQDMVKVLGGQVETLVTRTATLKAAMQKSTLPKEWSDSLGRIEDLGTDTRLDEEPQDETQERASPVRPQQAPVPVAPLSAIQYNNNMPSSPTVLRNGDGNGSAQTQNFAPSPLPPRAGPIPLALGKRPLSTTQPQTSTVATLSTNGLHSRPQIASNFALSSTAPTIPSAPPTVPEDDHSLLEMDVDSIVASRNSLPKPISTNSPPQTHSPPPADKIAEPPSKAHSKDDYDPLDYDYDALDAVESVDAYIDRVESSQLSRGSVHNVDYEAPDMEDMFAPSGDYLIGSQDLIEPPDDDDRDGPQSDGENWQMEVDDELSPRRDVTTSPERKKRKLAENENGDEDDVAAFYDSPVPLVSRPPARLDDDDDEEEELMIVSEAEFQTQVERNTEVTLISELHFITARNRRFKVHATCTQAEVPEVVEGRIAWTVLITDPSAEQLWISVDSSLAKEILNVSNISEWRRAAAQYEEQGPEVLKEKISELAKQELSGNLMLAWVAANSAWVVMSIA